MQPTRRAVIDVGTNSVKLLVGEVAGREVQPICERSYQTRLGQGFYETRRLRPEAIAATARAVANFAAMAREAQSVSVRVFATSAAREAVNREELTAAIEKASGSKVEVISGEQEAAWGFQGVTTNPELARMTLLLLDVGGGSMQCVFGRQGKPLFSHSFPLGSVRLLETLPCGDPPQASELANCRQWLREFLRREVKPKLAGAITGAFDTSLDAGGAHGVRALPVGAAGQHAITSAATQLVGVGGAASILGCMEAGLVAFDRARIEATRLSAERVLWHLERLWGLPLSKRKEVVGLPKNRADVILMGVAIYHVMMEEFSFPELRISTRGLRFAALTEDQPGRGV